MLKTFSRIKRHTKIICKISSSVIMAITYFAAIDSGDSGKSDEQFRRVAGDRFTNYKFSSSLWRTQPRKRVADENYRTLVTRINSSEL
jgi:hypothetical protein